MSEKFDIYSKIFFRDVGNFFRHLCELVLRHQMRVSNYFVNSFYSVGSSLDLTPKPVIAGERLRRPGINPPVYVAWRAGTSNKFVVTARRLGIDSWAP